MRPEKPIARAAAGVISITRPRTKGPRSLIRTTIERPVRRFVTRTRVPNGNDRCAAVMPRAWAYSPFAVRWPEYVEATPDWARLSIMQNAVKLNTNNASAAAFIHVILRMFSISRVVLPSHGEKCLVNTF